MVDDEVAPLNLSKKEPALEVPLNLSQKPVYGIPSLQTYTQGEIKNATWGIIDASSVNEEYHESTEEQKQTAAFALCQLDQCEQSKQTEDSSETTAYFSKYTETKAKDVLNNHQSSSTSLHDNCRTSTTVSDSTETDKTHTSSKFPDPKSTLDVNCPTPHSEGTTVVPSEPKTKGQKKTGRHGMQNAKRSRDSVPSNRILRKRLCC